MRLLIISHTEHYLRDGELVGWGPTVRELDYLSQLFDEVVHLAPVHEGPAPASALSYRSQRIRLRPVLPAGGPSAASKLNILRRYPTYMKAMREEMAEAQAVHVRCPANISLLALLLLAARKEPPLRWVKYAGNWRPPGPEPWSYSLQRRWLAQNRHRGVVTINGRWPGQPAHVRSFYNPSLTEEDLRLAGRLAAHKRLERPVELIFVGALNDAKGVGRLLQVAADLREQGLPFRLHVLGDGPDRPRYEAWAQAQRLSQVTFHGWIPRPDLPRFYGQAHFIVHPSNSSEGWPKVLSEAMAYGVVPIAGDVSSIPQILAETGAGVALPAEDIAAFTAAILRLVEDPVAWQAASVAGAAAAERFSYGFYQRAVADLFARAWGVQLRSPQSASEAGRTEILRVPVAGAQQLPHTHSTNGHGFH